MVIFHHTDDDGKCAGYWAGKLNKRKTGVCDHVTRYVPINYGDAIPWDQIANDELVYIVDFSFEPNDMDQLLSITKNVIWIDHHISAINKYKDYPHKIDGIRLNGVAGCLLTYMYLNCMVTTSGTQASSIDTLIETVIAPPYSDEIQSDLTMVLELLCTCPVPGFTKFIADWDMWKFKYANTKNFHTGFSTISHDPECAIWDTLNSDTDEARELLDSIILKGRTLIDYRQNWMSKYFKYLGFDAVFTGKGDIGRYKCFALNSVLSSDDFFIPEDNKDLYDVFVGFAFDGDKYRYSLRAAHEDVDVSAIAQHFGGGGHTSAAGFVSDKLEIRKISEGEH